MAEIMTKMCKKQLSTHFTVLISHAIISSVKEIDEDFNPGDEPTLYAYWAASVIGPVVHGLALVYALMFFNKVISLIGRIIGTIVSLQHFLLCCHVK